jgi:hypothetical protein
MRNKRDERKSHTEIHDRHLKHPRIGQTMLSKLLSPCQGGANCVDEVEDCAVAVYMC